MEAIRCASFVANLDPTVSLLEPSRVDIDIAAEFVRLGAELSSVSIRSRSCSMCLSLPFPASPPLSRLCFTCDLAKIPVRLRIQYYGAPAEQHKQILATVQACPTLSQLELDGVKVGFEGTRAVANSLLMNRDTLVELSLEHNSIGAEGMQVVADAMASCESLERVRIRDNEIRSEGAKAIAECVPGTMKEISLCDCEIGCIGAQSLALGMKKCRGLTVLDLRCNCISAQGACAIAAVLPYCRALAELILEDCEVSDQGARLIGDAMSSLRSLVKLNLAKNSISNSGVYAVAAAMPLCHSLASLNLSDNPCISHEGVSALSSAIPQCHHFSELDLARCNVGLGGCKAVATALSQSSTFAILNLEDTNPTDEGAWALSRADSQALSVLRFGKNHITIFGAAALAAGFVQRKQPIVLDLHENRLGKTGAGDVGWITCAELYLGRNAIEDAGAETLADRLQGSSRGLTVLSLPSNQIGDKGADAIAGAVATFHGLLELDLEDNEIASERGQWRSRTRWLAAMKSTH